MKTYLSIYRSSTDMILKVNSNFKTPLNIYLCLSQRIFFIHCNCFSVDKFNSKYHYKTHFAYHFFAMMIEIKFYDVIGVFFYVILFICKMPMQVLFQLNFPKTDVW